MEGRAPGAGARASDFHPYAGPIAVGRLAEVTGAVAPSAEHAARVISDVAPLGDAGPDHVTYFDGPRANDRLAATRAGACFVRAELTSAVPAGTIALAVSHPAAAFAKAGWALHPPPPVEPGVEPSARIDPTAELGADCRVETGAVIGAGARIGAGCVIGAYCVIGPRVRIGEGSRIGVHASLSHAILGARVIIHGGCRIGQDGFGYVPGPNGPAKIPQLGRVVIGDDVEIGANTCIDRGSLDDTVIGAGTKIDNLVQIGHNVKVGRGCILVSQVGLSGSVVLGDGVMIGGQGGIADHVTIEAGARVGAQSGVFRDIGPGETVIGSPARPIKTFWREMTALARLVERKKG